MGSNSLINLIAAFLMLIALTNSHYGYWDAMITYNIYVVQYDLNSENVQIQIYNYYRTPSLKYACEIVLFYSNATVDDIINNKNYLRGESWIWNFPYQDFYKFHNFSTGQKKLLLKVHCENLGTLANAEQLFFQGAVGAYVNYGNNSKYVQFQPEYKNYVIVPVENENPCQLVFQYKNFLQEKLIRYYPTLGEFIVYPLQNIDSNLKIQRKTILTTKFYGTFRIQFPYPGNWKIQWKPHHPTIFYIIKFVVASPFKYPQINIQQYCWNNCTQKYITSNPRFAYDKFTINMGECNAEWLNIDNMGPYINCTLVNLQEGIMYYENKVFENDITYCNCFNPNTTIGCQQWGCQCTQSCSLLQFGTSNDTKKIAQGCTCQQNFKWNPQNQTCQIDCTKFQGAEFLSVYFNRTTCKCTNPKYRWNAYSYKCVFDCAGIPHSTIKKLAPKYTDTNEIFACPCEKGYYWNASAIDCVTYCNDPNADWNLSVLNNYCVCKIGFFWDSTKKMCFPFCSFIANSLQLSLAPYGECSCVDNYVWNATEKVCRRNCTDVQNADLSAISTDLTKCSCLEGYVWSSQLSKCIFNCFIIPYVNASIFTQFSIQCSCVNNFNWDSTKKVCQRNCQGIQNADNTQISQTSDECICKSGFIWSSHENICRKVCQNLQNVHQTDKSSDPTKCLCIDGYKWSSEHNKCIINCYQIPNVNYLQVSSSQSDCPCTTGFTWNPSNKICKRNCQNVANADSSQISNIPQQCFCRNGFYWNSSVNICQRNCSNISNADPTKVSCSSTECVCMNGFYWNNSATICQRNCALISNSDPTQTPSNANVCVCSNGFYWNTVNNVCQRNCTIVENANTAQVSTNLNQCVCVNGFYWSITENGCRRNCTNVANVDSTLFSTNLNVCVCKSGYDWSVSSGICRRDCSQIQYTDTTKITSDPNICVCAPGFTWNATINLCFPSCDKIANSNGFNPTNPSKCLCKHKYGWNSAQARCQIICDYINDKKVDQADCMWLGSILASANPNTQTETAAQYIQTANQMSPQNSQSNNKKILIIVLCSVIGTLIALLIGGIAIYRRCKKNKQESKSSNGESVKSDKIQSMKSIVPTEMGLSEVVKVEGR